MADVACRPMVKWAIAQLEFAEMLNKVLLLLLYPPAPPTSPASPNSPASPPYPPYRPYPLYPAYPAYPASPSPTLMDPLRQELKALEDVAGVTNQEAAREVELITILERSINKYTEEYANLISQAEAIKTTQQPVHDTVRCSCRQLLLPSYSSCSPGEPPHGPPAKPGY